MNTSANKVDVLGIIDDTITMEESDGQYISQDLRGARAAVAELIERENALDIEACRLRGELGRLRNMLRGFSVKVNYQPLCAPMTYLTEVQLFCEFQPGQGEKVANTWIEELNFIEHIAKIGG